MNQQWRSAGGTNWRCIARAAAVIWLGMALSPAVARAQEVRDVFKAIPASELAAEPAAWAKRVGEMRARSTTAALSVVRASVAVLSDAKVRIALPDGSSIVLVKGKLDAKDANNFIWTGTPDGALGSATLVVHNGQITGSIQSSGGLYRIEPLGDGVHAAIKVDLAHLPPDHPPSFKQIERKPTTPPPSPAPNASTSTAPVGINVLVAYTSAAAAVTDIDATIQLAVTEANTSYQNSGINLQLNLVDSFLVSYSETGKDYPTILADFVALPEVNIRRNLRGADVALMIIDQPDFCGLADALMATAETAFAIVHYDCATGYYSFAHEIGHLQGARHDPANDPDTDPFAYGHGYQQTGADPWRTIMAYDCSPACDRIQYWSNPDVKYKNLPTGTSSTSNNSRVLNGTALTVDTFRNIVTQNYSAMSGDCPGNANVLTTTLDTSVDACAASCEKVATCRGFSYNAGNANGTCITRSATCTTPSSNGYLFYARLAPPNYFRMSGDCTGNNINNSTGQSQYQCAASCDALQNCLGFSYRSSDGTCFPKSATCTTPSANGYVFYARYSMPGYLGMSADCSGNEMRTTFLSKSVDTCAASCSTMASCRGFSFKEKIKKGGACITRSATCTTTETDGYLFYTRSP